jgi:2-C-methyl-D-erythritol 4-phosphate cytidylyltransferase
MPKTVACLVIKTPRVFTWLGHMPIMNWSLTQLREVRGIDRLVCVADPYLADRSRKLLARERIEVASLPRELLNAKEEALDEWLASAGGPASDSTILVVTKATSPFLPATKIEACVREVQRGKCTVCLPSRTSTVIGLATYQSAVTKEAVDGFRVKKINVPKEERSFKTVRVNLMESLDVNNADEFVLASALVESDKL